MAAGNFKDFTGEKFHGWEILKVGKFEKNKPTLWLARHKCGHEQMARMDQFRSGRESLCGKCGTFNRRVAAAKIASEMAARKPRVKKGPTMLEAVAFTRAKADELAAKPVGRKVGEAEKRKIVKRKLTPAEIGYEQAKVYARFNFLYPKTSALPPPRDFVTVASRILLAME